MKDMGTREANRPRASHNLQKTAGKCEEDAANRPRLWYHTNWRESRGGGSSEGNSSVAKGNEGENGINRR